MKKITAFIILVALLTGCEKRSTISVSGSTTVLPVVSRVAELFHTQTGSSVIVNAGGSGVGVNQLGSGKIDIGMISRDITESEIAKYPAVNFVTHTIGRDAVVPVVSSEIYDAGMTTLTLEQIGKIYLGEITNWSQLGGPDRDILVVDKESSRGTRHVFMNVVLGDKEAKAPGADLVLGSNNEEQTAIIQSDAALGMLSHAWLNRDVKGVTIQLNETTVVAPTRENIVNGTFPITRSLLLITNGNPTGDVKAFIDSVLSANGQQIVKEVGYVPVAE